VTVEKYNRMGNGGASGLQPAGIAVILRSAALFAILYQFRLIAADLADTAVFSGAVLAAFGAAVLLAWVTYNGKKINPLPALIAIGAAPWAVRALIAAPRLFIPGASEAAASAEAAASVETAAAFFDSILLNFDRNNFVSLLPFYWAVATTFFSLRSRTFLRAAVIADAVILIAAFAFTPVSQAALYRWPIVMIVMLAGIVLLQALALLFSMPPQTAMRKGEKAAAIAALFILIFAGGLIFLRPSQRQAAQKGGGLLEPKLFSFDFSQFIRLDPEISMSDDLIMIVKKDPRDNHILLRRSVLSGYSKKQGFYRIEEMDERTHPQRLPNRPVRLEPPEFRRSRPVNKSGISNRQRKKPSKSTA